MKYSILKIPILPAELITEILVRLPMKSLLKFRFVSVYKSQDYLKNCSLNDSVTEEYDLDYPTNDARQNVLVVGTVNGLICLAIGSTDLFLWNPSISKFVNGKLHWPNTPAGFNKYESWNILSFDLSNEKWGKVEPPYYEEGDIIPSVGVLGSDLSVFSNYQESHANVWVIKEYGVEESWINMYTIKHPRFPPFIYPTVCMSIKGEILVVSGSTIMIHNPQDESIIYLKGSIFDYSTASNIYVESLVCPLLQNEPSTQQE
ncbi:F-box/kelch-repeat protein At3g23880-like [Lycium ferocissimum]|uniref:F-box/kelch-repeat protein At3g23880-like n=1 Tax=Lycium ferocissimum TaxID=112874 RepID=UPI0028160F9E|nr:F-box/kelch-repeat protein At3g23880-like [Lycium ferocissimum]